MIIGLEEAVRSDQSEHPVLFNLNLSRPEWPRRLPRPIVLWVPEYVLALLGREAPDFLDWRSDTVYFLEPATLGMMPLSLEQWMSELWDRMPESLRRERIAELRSRLSEGDSKERVDVAAYYDWVLELGDHLSALGSLEEAEDCYIEALENRQFALDKTSLVSIYRRLGLVYDKQGRETDSSEYYRKAARAGDEMEEFVPAMDALRRFFEDATQVDQAEEGLRLSLDVFRQQNNFKGISTALSGLGALSVNRGRLEEAERMLLEALEIEGRWGSSLRMVDQLRTLGILYLRRGDLKRAEEVFVRGLAIGKELGDRMGVARTNLHLSQLFKLQGNLDKAVDALRGAHIIFSEIGASSMRELAEQQLRELTAQTSPSESAEGDTAADTEPNERS